jgi:TetR/AcrR family transcriptional repressor of mexAB-oprM operon
MLLHTRAFVNLCWTWNHVAISINPAAGGHVAMRRTKEEAEKTRCAILAAAETLFFDHGVAHTSLEQIAREAGVTRGAVYWHFQNKAHLFHEMLDQVRLTPEVMARHLADGGERPVVGLRQLCVEGLKDLARDPQRRRILTILLHRCEFTEDLREAEERHAEFIARFIDLCKVSLQQAEARGELAPGLDAARAAHTLHALVIGLFSEWLRDTSQFDPEQDAAPMIDALFRGLLRDWPY